MDPPLCSLGRKGAVLFPRDLIVSRGEFHPEAQPRDEIEARLTMIPREQKAAPVGRILLLVTSGKREFENFSIGQG